MMIINNSMAICWWQGLAKRWCIIQIWELTTESWPLGMNGDISITMDHIVTHTKLNLPMLAKRHKRSHVNIFILLEIARH